MRRSKPGDSGFSYVETIITVVLVSIVAVPLLMALTTAITASAELDDRAEADNVMRAVADSVNRVITGEQCWTAADYRSEVDAVLAARGWEEGAVVDVSHRVPVSEPDMVGPWVASACPADTAAAPRFVQLVTVTATSPGGETRTLRMVKGVV